MALVSDMMQEAHWLVKSIVVTPYNLWLSRHSKGLGNYGT